ILEINKIRENPEPNIVFPYRQNSIVPIPDDPTGRSEPGAQHPTTYLRGLTELFQDVNLFTGRCRCQCGGQMEISFMRSRADRTNGCVDNCQETCRFKLSSLMQRAPAGH